MQFFKKKKTGPTDPAKSPVPAKPSKVRKLAVISDSPDGVELILQAATLGEIAELYQVSRPTAKKWIQPIMKKLGKIFGRTFTVRQVEKIIKFLGIPGKRLRMNGGFA